MPGATLTAVDGPEFSGGVKVKLGPISLLYKGSGQFLETDEQARRVVIKASGKDSRGNGTASATVTVTLEPEGDAGTKGTVVTDLTVTGKPAQFGRGMIVEVGGKILDVFATCLASKLDTANDAPAETPAAEAAPAPVKAVPAKADEDDSADSAEEPPPPAKPKPATRRRTTAKAPAVAAPKATQTVSADVTDGVPVAPEAGEPRLQLVGEQADAVAKPAEKPAAPKSAPRQVSTTSEAEAIDLLDYAGPSVVKRLVPALLGIVAVIFLVRKLRKH
jgi:carbon monoxide dehydrogenase subunit G